MNIISNMYESYPKTTIALGMVAALILGVNLQSDPLAPVPLMNYQVIYDHGDNIYDDDNIRGGFLCEGRKGYYWWAKVIKPGLIDDEKIVGCAETQELAKKAAEGYLTKQLESHKSYAKMYEAFISKEDVVTFTEKKNGNQSN